MSFINVNKKMKKILLIHNVVTPTRTKLFNEMYMHFSKMGYDFKIIFTSETESNRKRVLQSEIEKFKFDFEILKSGKLRSKGNNDNHFFHINKNFKENIEQENPDIIIHAWWAWLSAWQSCNWCKKNKKKFILWSWSTKYEKSRRRTITKPLVKRLVSNSNSFRSYGTRASEYLISLWANPKKIYKLYNTVDIDFFIKQAEKLKPQKEGLKKELNIKNKKILLFIGQLIKRKWVYELLSGYNTYLKNHPKNDLWLVFIWSGQEERNLKKIVNDQKIDNVYFAWYKQKSEISKYFAISDILTLPSYEEVRWLVINEAMCFNLPIITTKYVWASVDLISKTNGVVLSILDTDHICDAIETTLWLEKISSSKKNIQWFNIEQIIKWIF